jgi:hypothetical protein
MGGDAGAESTPGRGSLFWFTARLQKRAAQVAKRTTATSGCGCRTALAASAFHGSRILVVDDEPVNREVARC